MQRKPRKIVGAKADAKGNITKVRLQGNTSFTPLKTAIKMAKRKEIDAVPVKRSTVAKAHLRTRPDKKKKNNLDNMAGDR